MDSDEGDEPGRDTAADSQGDTPTTVVDLTDQSGPARRFYANLADL